jgi:GNAT superfamily N-acetyltransferase
MLPQGIEFRPMTEEDIAPALRIIGSHDEEDGEEAAETYEEFGTADQYVLTERGEVIGVTGCRAIDYTDRSYWLSWTCMAKDQRRKGLGEAMLSQLIEVMGGMNARRLFVNTSDLPKYSDAIQCYENQGFRLEVNYQDYYCPGESRLTYARRIGPLYGIRPVFEPSDRGVFLAGAGEIDETDGAYYIGWDYSEDGAMFHAQDLSDAIERVRYDNGRCIFVGFPSALAGVETAFQAAGFVNCGRLVDFYEDGLDEIHYRLNL